MTDTKKRMAGPRLIALWLISLALLAGACPVALAQGTDTVYDEAGVLTESQEQNVQEAFDSAQEEAGQPIDAFLVPDTGVLTPQDRQDLLTQEASEANVGQDAGVIMVAPNDRWDVAANLERGLRGRRLERDGAVFRRRELRLGPHRRHRRDNRRARSATEQPRKAVSCWAAAFLFSSLVPRR